MDSDLEKDFLYRFIIKEKRKRLLYELSGKKRIDGISRFCHCAADLICKDTIIRSGNDLFLPEILRISEKYVSGKQAYIIAYNEELDRMTCDIQTALDLVLGNGMAAVILLDTVAIIETEQCIGTPYRYLLYRKKLLPKDASGV
ncbi:MAG: hypothetical protein K2K70_02485 [Lachnospiraceae bacterium]|nr:hypothetical protein [Lachnospiraceae bacterium]